MMESDGKKNAVWDQAGLSLLSISIVRCRNNENRAHSTIAGKKTETNAQNLN